MLVSPRVEGVLMILIGLAVQASPLNDLSLVIYSGIEDLAGTNVISLLQLNEIKAQSIFVQSTK